MDTISNFKKYGIKPNKLMGQNFLISQKFRQKIIETADLSPEDTIIEVGAGNGSLTFEIAKKVKRIFAVEKDKRFAEALQKLVLEQNINPALSPRGSKYDRKYNTTPIHPYDKSAGYSGKSGIKNIIVINEDILKLDLTVCHCERPQGARQGVIASEAKQSNHNEIASSPLDKLGAPRNDEYREYKLVGNIPYYLTSRLLRKFLAEEELKPKEIILTVQKEVAERIVALPPHMNLLALSVQAYGKPEIIEKIPASAFWPKPKVDSAIIKISEISDKFFIKNKIEQKLFFSIIKTCFQQKRKKLVNSLVRHCERLKPKPRAKRGGKQTHGHKTLEIASSLRPAQLAFAPRNDVLGQSKTSKQKIAEIIKKAGIPSNARPEELSLENWVKLIK